MGGAAILNDNNTKLGLTNGVAAYIIWGLLPIYWKLVQSYEPAIVFSHRILWSFVFMLLLLLVTKQWQSFWQEFRRITKEKRSMLLLICIASLISMNWLIFIWAVQNNYVIQSSLGYYMNPLINILLGVIFLKEKLSKAQVIAFILALIAVLYLTIYYGVFPWISLSLAFSFGLYGLLKKIIHIHSMYSLTIETMIVVPFVIIYFIWTDYPVFTLSDAMVTENILLLFSGVATAVPLLLFGSAVKYLPYTTMGFLQYIAPTFMLIIGVFMYHEPFTYAHGVTFTLIWLALILYMLTTYRQFRKIQINS